jgi:phage gp45-like
MSILANLARWVRVRGLREGPMQIGRVEGLPNDARDDAQRPQDYGFAAMPVDGQGLKLEIGGHAIIIRMDRLAERPHLAEYEVCVWHKEGHKLTLKAGGVVQVDCTQLVINAPLTAISGDVTVGGTIVSGGDMTGAGVSLQNHTHGGVSAGPSDTAPPN